MVERAESGRTAKPTSEGSISRRRKRDMLPGVTKKVVRKLTGRSRSLAPEEKISGDNITAPQNFVTFCQLDSLLMDSISSIKPDISSNPRMDWISGNFPQAAVLAELKKARKALRDIGTGRATVELFDGRDDDLGFLIQALGIKGGKKELPISKKATEERLAVIDNEIQDLSNRGSSGRELEILSLERIDLAFQITLLGLPERDYVELEKIKGANTSMEGVLADVVHYSFVGVPHSKVTIALSDEMREKAKGDLQNLPPLAAKG